MTGLSLTWLDLAALGWFAAVWGGYSWYADHSDAFGRSMTAAMNAHRHRWMREMLGRELRMVDTNILGNLVTGVGFFASTSILVIGGLVALLGAADQAVEALSHLPFAATTAQSSLEAKVLLLLAIFIYAFFKFAWAFRLSNYCSILVGGAPYRPKDEAEADLVVRQIASVHSLVAHHFNRGLRAYFLALAVLGWFLHPLVFAIASTLVVAELWRREFRSRALAAIREGLDESLLAEVTAARGRRGGPAAPAG